MSYDIVVDDVTAQSFCCLEMNRSDAETAVEETFICLQRMQYRSCACGTPLVDVRNRKDQAQHFVDKVSQEWSVAIVEMRKCLHQ